MIIRHSAFVISRLWGHGGSSADRGERELARHGRRLVGLIGGYAQNLWPSSNTKSSPAAKAASPRPCCWKNFSTISARKTGKSSNFAPSPTIRWLSPASPGARRSATGPSRMPRRPPRAPRWRNCAPSLRRSSRPGPPADLPVRKKPGRPRRPTTISITTTRFAGRATPSATSTRRRRTTRPAAVPSSCPRKRSCRRFSTPSARTCGAISAAPA